MKFASDLYGFRGVVDRDHFVQAADLEKPDEDVGHNLLVVDDQDALLLQVRP